MIHPIDIFGVVIDGFWHPVTERVEHVNGNQDMWLVRTACGLGVYEKLEDFSKNVRWHAINIGNTSICPKCSTGPKKIIHGSSI